VIDTLAKFCTRLEGLSISGDCGNSARLTQDFSAFTNLTYLGIKEFPAKNVILPAYLNCLELKNMDLSQTLPDIKRQLKNSNRMVATIEKSDSDGVPQDLRLEIPD